MAKKKAPKKSLVPKREVQRIHLWKPGHDPNDPDAYKGSGWEYIHISGDTPADTQDKRNKYKMGGGPESGIPCVCGEMTRIVEEVSVLTIIEQNVVVNGQKTEITFSPEQKERFAKEKVAILLCPKCESITQFRAALIAPARERWLAKQK